MRFSDEDLGLLARAVDVAIETGPRGGDVHRVRIWAVVDDDEVFARSWQGAAARWYREAVEHGEVVLEVDGRRLAARAAPAADDLSIERTSRGLEAKYAGDPAVASMVRSDILETTVRLDPA